MNEASNNRNLEEIQFWQGLIKVGSNLLAAEFFDKIVDGTITDLSAVDPTCEFSLSFSDLQYVEYEVVKHYYDLISQKHGEAMAEQFVQFLFEECILSDRLKQQAEENRAKYWEQCEAQIINMEEMNASLELAGEGVEIDMNAVD
jgi:hypothetical protein